MIATRKSIALTLWRQLPFLLWLVALWMLLWGQFTVLAAVSGLVVALTVTNLFRLPAVEVSGRFNLWWFLVFGVTFLFAVVRGSLVVAWLTIRPKRVPGAGIIEVPLATDDDFIMTSVGIISSLIPGSLIVEADRDRRILYLHDIEVRSVEDLDARKRAVWIWEDRIVRAIGSREQVQQIEHRAERTSG